MTQGGMVGIDAVEIVTEERITDGDARDAGFPSRDNLLSHLAYREDPIYRIRVHWAGENPRIALRADDDLNDHEMATLIANLSKLDKHSKHGKWTLDFLELIRERPATLAARLAAEFGLETAVFKLMVRKLKALGLTESLEVGYRLSPRGERILNAIRETLVSK